jgi:protein involved in polysaccharide export with SLBB domain
MKIIRIISFVFFISFIFLTRVNAQNTLLNTNDLTNINVDSYSDEQLADMAKRASESGISETQLYKILADKGLPSTEITKLKTRLALINANENQNIQKEETGSLSEKNISGRLSDSTNNLVPIQKFKTDETIFGSELFTTSSQVFEPNLHIPAPAGYLLGPDDEIVVSIYGYSEKKYNLTINNQGEIYIPNVGPILVNGLTIDQATEKIKSRLASSIYRAISTGQTKVQVSLGKIKSIRITVIGQAKKPGTFTVSSLTTLFNALYLCGGPASLGSYRDIQVIGGNDSKRTADLYNFLVNGDQKDNMMLHEGDVIMIPYYKKRVTISGKVKREGKFEMLDNETFSDLLKYCGGFTDDAYRGAVTVTRITDTDKKIIDVESAQYNNFQPAGSDDFNVRKLQDEYSNRLVISGAISRPGSYQLTADLTVKDLIDKAGGLKKDAYTKRVVIYRYLNNKTPTTVSFNLDSVLQFGDKVYLQKDDSININSIFDFTDKNFITVEGNVRKPGVIQWRENFTLRDLLLSAGGLTQSGDSSNIEILRRIIDVNVEKANHDESAIFKIDLTDKNQLQNNIFLQPYDMVIIKTLPGYTPQRSVIVQGEVLSPGKYGLENSEEKISEIIQRTRGFKASADSSSITIRRISKSNLTKEEKENLFQRILNINPDSVAQNPRLKEELYQSYDLISVDLGTILAHPESPENLALEDGDILTISRSTNLVKVTGEVYFPTLVSYQPNRNLKYYIQQAGNFTLYARKAGSLVIYPDGKAASVKRFLWFKRYPSVTPRSEVFVPQKEKNNRSKLSVGELAVLVSSLAIIVNVLKL